MYTVIILQKFFTPRGNPSPEFAAIYKEWFDSSTTPLFI